MTQKWWSKSHTVFRRFHATTWIRVVGHLLSTSLWSWERGSLVVHSHAHSARWTDIDTTWKLMRQSPACLLHSMVNKSTLSSLPHTHTHFHCCPWRLKLQPADTLPWKWSQEPRKIKSKNKISKHANNRYHRAWKSIAFCIKALH